ncbi:MAG: enoyl-CoA hydratase-related protein [Acidimicrobiia bacterium]|nr:enoyl-CoA hydratase-related protein [Acidimicrobiia bacterium]
MARIDTLVEGPIGWLVLDNPERRNAMNQEMYAAVPDAMRRLVTSGDVRVVVVRGAGEVAFGAGSDISEFPDKRDRERWPTYARIEHEAHEAVRAAPVPVLAMIHGPCRGGGAALALCTDLRYAADGATFAVPPARLGVGYPVDGYETLAAAVGIARAKELTFTARVIDATEALGLGLIHEVVATADLEPRVREVAAEIAALAPLTLRSAKTVLTELGRPESQRDVAAMEASVRFCYDSADYQEGIAAFLEKRRPDFSGR